MKPRFKKLIPLLVTFTLISGCYFTKKASQIKTKVLGETYVAPVYDGIFSAKGSSSKSNNGLEVFPAKYIDKNMYKETRKGLDWIKRGPVNEIEQGWEIILKDPQGFHRLTTNEVKDYNPKIDPDGSYIVFERKTDIQSNEQEIYKLDLKTGIETKLTDQRYCENPVISPDGSKIAYNLNNNIWIMDKDGSNQRELLNLNKKIRIYGWEEKGLIFAYGDSILPNAIIDFEKKEVNDYRL